jgi:hypothetical protein
MIMDFGCSEFVTIGSRTLELPVGAFSEMEPAFRSSFDNMQKYVDASGQLIVYIAGDLPLGGRIAIGNS